MQPAVDHVVLKCLLKKSVPEETLALQPVLLEDQLYLVRLPGQET